MSGFLSDTMPEQNGIKCSRYPWKTKAKIKKKKMSQGFYFQKNYLSITKAGDTYYYQRRTQGPLFP